MKALLPTRRVSEEKGKERSDTMMGGKRDEQY
jgi:hypothetical protein